MIFRVKAIAESFGGTADITIVKGLPTTFNDSALTAKMLPSLQKSDRKKNVITINAITGAKKILFFQKEIQGSYFFVGGKPLNVIVKDAASHHTPDFFIDKSGSKLDVKSMLNLTLDYLNSNKKKINVTPVTIII